MFPFAILDPHIHQWDPRHTPRTATPLVKLLGRYPRLLAGAARALFPRPVVEFVGSTEYVLGDYLPKQYSADIAPQAVEGVVHIEADWADHLGLGPTGETRWVGTLPFANNGITLAGIVAYGDPSSDHFDRLLTAHREASPLFCGIRKMAARHDDQGVHAWDPRPNLYRDARFLRGFERLAAHGLRFDAWVYSNGIDEVTELARRFPEVPLVLDHVGTPVGVFGPVGRSTGRTAGERAGILSAWKDAFARLADLKHAHVKLSGLLQPVLGLGYHARREKPRSEEIAQALAPIVDHALDVFGPSRCMFASNFPMDKVSADFSSIANAYATIVASRGGDALRSVFRETARRFYGLDR